MPGATVAAQDQMSPLLTVENVVKRFGGVLAVDHCSLHIQRGTVTGLIGPNGAGKTTLFNIIAGVYRPDAGRIWFEGERIDGLAPHQIFARKIARTFQIARELKRLTVLENLLLVPAHQDGECLRHAWLHPQRVRRQEQALRTRAQEVLRFVKLDALQDAHAANLSGGQKKLLELARAMMSEARLILLDEPAAGVNPTLLRELTAHIRHLQRQGCTFLLIEHNMELVMELCDPVIVMHQGQKLLEGPPLQVGHDPRLLQIYLGV